MDGGGPIPSIEKNPAVDDDDGNEDPCINSNGYNALYFIIDLMGAWKVRIVKYAISSNHWV